MIRIFRATLALITLMGSLAWAQDAMPRVQVFGGFSILLEDTRGLSDTQVNLSLHNPTSAYGIRSNFNGWNAGAQYNWNRWVSFAVDFSGYSGVPFTATTPSGTAGLPTQSRDSFLVGAVGSYRNKTKFTPYAHALFGLERAHLNASTPAGSVPPFTTVDTTFDDFAAVLGGGVDYRVARRISLRLAQLDWYHTTLNTNKFFGEAFDSRQFQVPPTHQKNVRFSTGIVVNF